MNFALSALLLALLLLPGGLFRYGYLRGLFRRSPAVSGSLSDDLAWVLAAALAVHAAAIALLASFGIRPDYRLLMPILTGQFGRDALLLDAIIRDLPALEGGYALYFGATSLGAYLLGVLLHAFVRNTGLDLQVQLFRFPNDWYYALDARANRRRFGRRWFTPDVYFSAVVEQKNCAYLYRGIVRDWYLDRAGNFDRVELSGAHRRSLDQDRKAGQEHIPLGDDRYYATVGSRLLLRAGEVQTMNVQYVFAVEEEEFEVDDKTLVVEEDAPDAPD